MRFPLSVKILSVVALGMTSAFTMSVVMSKRNRAHGFTGRPAKTPPSSETVTVLATPGMGYRPELDVIHSPNVLATQSMSMQADVKGKTVHVEATARLQDKREGMRFVWAVRFHPEDDPTRTLFQKVYDDQIFTPGVVEVFPTFSDDIDVPLPAGNYLVSLGAYRIPPTEDLKSLNFDRNQKGPWNIFGITIEQPRQSTPLGPARRR